MEFINVPTIKGIIREQIINVEELNINNGLFQIESQYIKKCYNELRLDNK